MPSLSWYPWISHSKVEAEVLHEADSFLKVPIAVGRLGAVLLLHPPAKHISESRSFRGTDSWEIAARTPVGCEGQVGGECSHVSAKQKASAGQISKWRRHGEVTKSAPRQSGGCSG